ncbi:hypothetical protein CTAYLR_002667 [Chrysophaeum taylorii]|uniref:LrgB-like protein n=1 Tax=Chrysophaeum taylorii TaxID=2483200 RepID=A0AAD7UBI9_9STRA|nr:hypothetical protein CTAYLR_002667 [Chrysophaeum taylorii]
MTSRLLLVATAVVHAYRLAPPLRGRPVWRRHASVAVEPERTSSRLGGALALVALDETARVALRGTGLPHSLVAGGALLTLLVGLRDRGKRLHASFFAPGAALALAWMPAFFVPALVALPLTTPVVTTPADALKFGGVVVAGLLMTLKVVALTAARAGEGPPSETPAAEPATRPFAAPLLAPLSLGAVIGGALALRQPAAYAAFFSLATLAMFVASVRANKHLSGVLKTVANPVVVCGGWTTFAVRLFAAAANLDPLVATAAYAATAGAALQRLLGACVVAFSCGVYAKRAEIIASWKTISVGVAAGVAAGLYGTAILCRLLGLPPAATKALLPRCNTTPFAITISDTIGADPGAAVAVVVVTGVLGAVFGPGFLANHKPKHRGLAVGAAAHGIGTAQLAQEPNAQAYAAIAMSLCGALSVVACSIPLARSSLFWLAGL